MPQKKRGTSASTQAGEFVHEEIEHVREGKHGARSDAGYRCILHAPRRSGCRLENLRWDSIFARRVEPQVSHPAG